MQRASLIPLASAIVALAAGACAPQKATDPVVNGKAIVPINPSIPGDALFQSGVDAFTRARTEQVAGAKAKAAGDLATATAQFALAVTDFVTARGLFDQLTGDATLCPAPSIRCDDAAYLAGRSSYEIGLINSDQVSFTDAETRLDAMLKAWPASAFVDAADFFDGRAHFELTRQFKVGAYTDAEPFFERAYAANPAGSWAAGSEYWDGRSEFELGYGLVNAAAALGLALIPTSADYLPARAWFDQAIGVLGSVPSRFPTSVYLDNAAYYLGRSWLERPTPGTTPDPEREAELTTAISVLTSVIGMTGSPFIPGAHYWRGRAHYDFSSHRTLPADATADLDLALADFHAVDPASPWRPHALEWAVKAWLLEGNKAMACSEYAAMAAAYPLPNLYTTRAQTALGAYLTANGLTCP